MRGHTANAHLRGLAPVPRRRGHYGRSEIRLSRSFPSIRLLQLVGMRCKAIRITG